MLYTASYFELMHHHGRLLSISRSVPKGFKVDGKLGFLAPNAQLIKAWKDKSIDEAALSDRIGLLKYWGAAGMGTVRNLLDWG